MSEQVYNWAGNYAYRAVRLHVPATRAEAQAIVRRSRQVKALGTRHSFNDIADSSAEMISLERLNRIVALDPLERTVTIEGGVRYGELCRYLDRAGFALPNLASLPHISVVGACATATHGSGNHLGILATAVRAIELITADGDIVTLRRDHDAQFHGAVVNLGGLGVVTSLTLDLVPAFAMRQDVYQQLPLDTLMTHFDAITSSSYSVSLFTDWRAAVFNQVWLKRRVIEGATTSAEPAFFGAPRATRPLHPIAQLSAANCTEQLGAIGPWHARLPHFRLEYTPSAGAELQSEYLLPRQHAEAALTAIAELRDHLAPALLISEVRTVAADELWMSPCYRQACIAIHFTWQPDWPTVRQILPRIEAALAPLGARPHWGKLFTLPQTDLRARYERLSDFQALLQTYDPHGKFRNSFLDRYIFDTS